MKFKAFDKRTGKYRDDVFINKDGKPYIGRGSEGLDKAINDYYETLSDDVNQKALLGGGTYYEIDLSDWYAIENIEIEYL